MTDKRTPLTTTLFIVSALVLAVAAKIGLDLPKEQPTTFWALALGFLLFGTGLIIFRSSKSYQAVEPKIQKIADWFGVKNWQVLLVFASPIFMLLASAAAGPVRKMHSPAFAVISWILGIGLAFIGSYRWGEEQPKPSKSTIFFLIIVTVIAFLFRGLGTRNIPTFLTGDEAAAGISAVAFENGDWNNIFITTWYSFPSLFSFIQSISIDIFGQTTEALRVLSAIVGALTVATVYLVGKAMFGQRAGVFAALFLTALHFHIHFSRLGLNNIWDGLWYTLTVGALWYGWERNNRLRYLLAGLALGFSQYFYVSSRGLFGIVILGMFIAFLFQRARFYKSIPDLVLMFAISTAVIFPLLSFYVQEPEQFFAPFARASFLREGFHGPYRAIDGTLLQLATKQIWIALQAYTYLPIHFWYKPETPILRPMFATFFYFGIIFLLLRNRDSRLGMLSLWLIVCTLIGALSESPLAAQRYVAAAPLCALLAGYGLHKITDTLQTLWGKYAKPVGGLSYMILAIAMISDLYFYFIEYQAAYQLDNIASHGTIAQQVANHLEDQPEGTQVVFFSIPDMGYYSIQSIQYLAPQVEGIDVPTPWTSFDKTKLSAKHIVFVFLPEREREIENVMAEYPNGTLVSEKAWNSQVLFWTYDYIVK